jgi:hypothetical protein
MIQRESHGAPYSEILRSITNDDIPSYSPPSFPTRKCLNVLTDFNVNGNSDYHSNSIKNVTTLEVQILTNKFNETTSENNSNDILLIPDGNTIISSLSGSTYICGDVHISGTIDLHKSNIKNSTCISSKKIICDSIQTHNLDGSIFIDSDIAPKRKGVNIGTERNPFNDIYVNDITINGKIYNEHGSDLFELIEMLVIEKINQNDSFNIHEIKEYVESTKKTILDTNTCLGINSLPYHNPNTTYNTAIGHSSLSIKNGTQNIAIGCSAMGNSNNVSYNVAIGTSSLRETNSTACVAIGHESLSENILGNENVAVGYRSLQFNGNVSGLVSIGTNSLRFNKDGMKNTGVGHNSLILNSSGNNNTALGYNAGNISLTNNNTFIGTNSSKSSPLLHDVTAIGYNAVGKGNGFIQLGDDRILKNVLIDNIILDPIFDSGNIAAMDIIKRKHKNTNAELHFRTQMVCTEEWINGLTELASIDSDGNFVKGDIFHPSSDWNNPPPKTMNEAINRIAYALSNVLKVTP